MFSIIGAVVGPLFLFTHLLGYVLVFVTLIGMMVYHLARRQEDPNGFWTWRAGLGYGGALCAGFGMISMNFMFIMLGFALWIGSFWCDRTPATPAPPPAV